MSRPTLLRTPIAYMSKVYHERYHLNYVHAKKLFFFDLLLIAGTCLLIASTIFWYAYDPTIEDEVELHIVATDATGTPITRIASGELITYQISYRNASDAIMTRPQLEIVPPAYFQIATITAHSIPFDETTGIFSLSDIHPGDGGTIFIQGTYFGTPDTYEHVSVILSYIQDGRTMVEAVNSTIISSLRDALLTGSITLPEIIRGTGDYPISLTLQNDGALPITAIVLPTAVSGGTIVWDQSDSISELAGGATITVPGTLSVSLPRSTVSHEFIVTPAIRIDDTNVAQDPLFATVQVVHPALSIRDITWDEPTARPGDVRTLTVGLTNPGDSTLRNIHIALPINQNVIDITRTRALISEAIFENGTLYIPVAETLAVGERKDVQIPIAIQYVPSGATDISFELSPTGEATAPGDSAPVRTEADSPTLAIGTALLGSAHSRYYTNEGDQLGRGPLPPIVGEETKYWVLVTLQNTTSRIEDVSFVGTLGPNVTWTGRSSVSLGNDIRYDAATSQVRWNWNSISASQTVGLYMELAIVPTAADIGTTPPLLTDISYRGTDTYIGADISRRIGDVRADLAEDDRGNTRGTLVQ